VTEYYYTIHINKIQNDLWQAYSPQIPTYSVSHIDKKYAASLLIEGLISIFNTYLSEDKPFPPGFQEDENYVTSLKGKKGINILTVIVDEEVDYGRVGLFPTMYGFIAYYFPQENLWSKKGLKTCSKKYLFEEQKEADSENEVIILPAISHYGFNLPILFPCLAKNMEQSISALLKEVNQNIKVGDTIKDQEEIRMFLTNGLEIMYQHIHQKIHNYDIRALLSIIIGQYELLAYLFVREYQQLEKQNYASLPHLEIFVDHYHNRDQAKTELHRSLQHLIEIISAESPSGNKEFGIEDYLELLADAVLFSKIQNLRNLQREQHHKNPENTLHLIFKPTDIMINQNVGVEWNAYGGERTEDILLMGNQSYKHYRPKNQSLSPKMLEEFDKACLAEFGLTHCELEKFNEVITTIQLPQDLAFSVCLESELINQLWEKHGLDKEKGEEAINQFCLTYRNQWNKIDGKNIYDMYDIDKHYFPYSFYSHPIVKIKGYTEDNNEIVISNRNWAVFFNDLGLAIQHGGYVAQSPELKIWQSKFRNLDGEAFEISVENWMKEHTDFIVHRGFNPSKIFSLSENIGDIDIVCIDVEKSIFYSIECKNYPPVIDKSGITSTVNKFSNTMDRKTPASKHSKRHNWLVSHKSEIMHYFHLNTELRIVSLYMTSHRAPPTTRPKTVFPTLSFSDLLNENTACLERCWNQ